MVGYFDQSIANLRIQFKFKIRIHKLEGKSTFLKEEVTNHIQRPMFQIQSHKIALQKSKLEITQENTFLT